MSMVSGIVTECRRREYSTPQALAALTVAIDESWSASTNYVARLDALDALRLHGGSPVDEWYLWAMLQGLPAVSWQAYKARLYTHLGAAQVALGTGVDPVVQDWQPLMDELMGT